MKWTTRRPCRLTFQVHDKFQGWRWPNRQGWFYTDLSLAVWVGWDVWGAVLGYRLDLRVCAH